MNYDKAVSTATIWLQQFGERRWLNCILINEYGKDVLVTSKKPEEKS